MNSCSIYLQPFSHNTKTHFWVSMQTASTIMLHAQQKDCNCANAAEGIGRPLAAELTSVGLVFILLPKYCFNDCTNSREL